jgi:hypothetical protein
MTERNRQIELAFQKAAEAMQRLANTLNQLLARSQHYKTVDFTEMKINEGICYYDIVKFPPKLNRWVPFSAN